MGFSVFPTPAIAGQQDNWVQIATSTPTSGSSVSFTSIPTNYRKLWLVTTGQIVPSASATLVTTINTLTGANDYRFWRVTDADALPGIYNGSTSSGSINLYFYNPTINNLPFVTFDGGTMNTASNGVEYHYGYVAPATTNITTIDITLSTGDFTTNTGTFVLYGTE